VTHLDGAVLHRIDHLKAGNDFTGGEHLDLEFVVGGLCHRLAQDLGTAVQRIERFRPAAGHPPFDLGRGLRNRRRGNGRGRDAYSGGLDEVTSFH
jgi:hypothetical protein